MAYVDLTSRFTYGLALVFGDHSKLANNDDYLKANGWQDGTVGIFFQGAAPTGWTKILTVNDQAVRVVSGFGGGVGGSQPISSGVGLAHTNPIAAASAHTHNLGDHQHSMDSVSQGSLTDQPTIFFGSQNFNANADIEEIAGTTTTMNKLKGQTAVDGGGAATSSDGAHDHGGATQSGFAPVKPAYADVLFCSKDVTSAYFDLTATFVHNTREVFDYFEQLAQNDNYNQQRSMPAASVSIFGSATSPTGWTKQVSQDDKALRVVSGTGGGSGGTASLSGGLTLAHTHAITAASHNHTIPNHKHNLDTNGTATTTGTGGAAVVGTGNVALQQVSGAAFANQNQTSPFTKTDGGGGAVVSDSHDHGGTGSGGTNVTLAYLDVIQASKDSAGAPAAYTDMRGFFLDQDLLAYQDLQKMANNDAYLNYHTMPSGGVMFFFQSSAPLNWTKLITQDDKALRVVSGTSGGTTGGAHALSAAISLVHTHSISRYTHHHSQPTHQHSLDSTVQSLRTTAGDYLVGAGNNQLHVGRPGGGSSLTVIKGQTATDGGGNTADDVGHDHGGATGSAGVDVTLAYADAIMCQKN